MRITTGTLFLAFAAFLNSIGISTSMPPKTRDFLTNFGMSSGNEERQDPNSQPEYLPGSALILGLSSLEPHDSPGKHPSVDARSPAEPSLHTRSRSPPFQARFMDSTYKIVCSDGTTYGLDQLQYIRVISYKNPHRLFGLRKHTFPTDRQNRLYARRHVYVPMPIEEQIVLSASDGYIYAILEHSGALSGIYAYNSRTVNKSRAKINVESGMVTLLTPYEINEIPVGPLRQIISSFRVEHVNVDRSR